MKLLYRITITIIATVLFTGIILTSYSLSVQKTLITSQLDRKGRVLAEVLSTSVMNHLISYDFYTIKLLFEPLAQDKDVVAVALIGPDGYIKMHSQIEKIGTRSQYVYADEDYRDEKILKKEILTEDLHQYLFFSPVEIDHIRKGVIEVILTDRESLKLISSFSKRILLLASLVLIVSIAAAYYMSLQISNPVIELTEDIKRFLMRRPRPGIGQDRANEITILKETFHAMMDEIQNSIEFRVKNEKMAVLGHLSAVLAHEVKNPLEPIKGSAEMLKLKHPGNESVLRYTKIIQSEVSELISFLDSFLDVAKSSDISTREIDINKAVSDTLLLLDYTLNKEQIRVDLELEAGLPPVGGDSGMIKQVLLNLLLNAIHAKTGEAGLIEISTESNDSLVNICIRDYGAGVDKAIIGEIFQPFFSTKEQGTGIGLSTSRHIVNLHKGNISVESETGAWTLFTIELPRFRGDSQ